MTLDQLRIFVTVAEMANMTRAAEVLHLSPDGPISATVIIVELLGAETHVICHTETGARIIVRQSAAQAKPALGENVHIGVDPDPPSYHLFDAATGDRLGGPA